jgi:hypothetical protein
VSPLAGREPGVDLAGRAVHVLHGVLGGGLRGGAVDGVQVRARRRHLRLPPLHRRQPRPFLVRSHAPPATSPFSRIVSSATAMRQPGSRQQQSSLLTANHFLILGIRDACFASEHMDSASLVR